MKVSVIVPSYNYGHFISETLDSVLNQTYKDWECIIVDDGSTDDTRQIVEKYVKSDNRFKYLYQNNKGLAGARNTGILNASGEYIQLLDADDLILPKKLELQVNFLENNSEYSVIYSDFRYFKNHDRNNLIDSGYKHWTGYVFEKLIRGNFLVVNSVLVRRECIDKTGLFSERLSTLEDWDFWLRIAYYGYEFYYLDKILALCRWHGARMSKDRINMARGRLAVVEATTQYVNLKRIRGNLRMREILADAHFELGKVLMKRGCGGEGRFEIWKSIVILILENPVFQLKRILRRLLVLFWGEGVARGIVGFVKKNPLL